MFDTNTPNGPTGKVPEDMFSDVPMAPLAPRSVSSATPSDVPDLRNQVLEVSGPIFSPGKLWTTVGVVVIVLIIAGGTYWWMQMRGTSIDLPVQQSQPSVNIVTPPPLVAPVAPPDTDQDGLDDTLEGTLHTDPLLADTDGDGLNDRDEVQVYKTDPLRMDTDDDSYVDGVEVQNGYNPNGAGKIVNEEEDIKKLQQ